MRGLFSVSSRKRAVTVFALSAIAVTGAVMPLAGTPALADPGAASWVGFVSTTPGTGFGKTGGANVPTAAQRTADQKVTFRVQTNSTTPNSLNADGFGYAATTGASGIKARVTSGPDLGTVFGCTSATVEGNLISACEVFNDFSKGLGIDNYTIFVDKNADNSLSSGEPFITASATWVGPANSVTMTAPASMAEETCTPVTVSLLDLEGRSRFSDQMTIQVSQPNSNNAGLAFCGQFPEQATPAGSVWKSSSNDAANLYNQKVNGVTTGAPPVILPPVVTSIAAQFTLPVASSVAKSVTFGIKSGTTTASPAGVEVKVFADTNANFVEDGEPVATKTVVVNPGRNGNGVDPINGLTLSTPFPIVDFNHAADGTIDVIATTKNAAGNPVANVNICYTITGAHPQDTRCSQDIGGNGDDLLPTDQNGRTHLTQDATVVGVSTFTVWVDRLDQNVRQRDANEDQEIITRTVSGNLSDVGIDLVAQGTSAGGTNRSTSDANIAESAIRPVGQSQELFTAKVTSRSTGEPRANVVVRFTLGLKGKENDLLNALTAVPNGSLGTTTAISDSNGIASVLFTRGALMGADTSYDGYAYSVVATVPNTVDLLPTDDARVLFSASDPADVSLAAGTITANTVRTLFPNTKGSLTLNPTTVETAPHTVQGFTATLKDQFGAPVGDVPVYFSVTAQSRNPFVPTFYNCDGTPAHSRVATPVPDNRSDAQKAIDAQKNADCDNVSRRSTDAAGQLLQNQLDNGPLTESTDPNNPATFDRIFAYADLDSDGVIEAYEPGSANFGTVEAIRNYRASAVGPNDPAVMEGGIGAPTPQFSGTQTPFNPVTSDDNAAKQIDVTNVRSAMTPVNVFFQIRNNDNTKNFAGSLIAISSTGVGSLVDATNAVKTGSQIVQIDANGYGQFKALSTATGVQTITATAAGNITKSLNITWTNTGLGRYVSLTPATATVNNGQVTQLTAKVTDVYNNPVALQNLSVSVSGPGLLTANNATSGVAPTDATGLLVFGVKSTGSGSIVVTVTASGPQFSAAVNTPESGKAAGNATASSTLNAAGQGGSPSTATFSQNPGGVRPLGSVTRITATIKDAAGVAQPGVKARFIITGAEDANSTTLTSASDGTVFYDLTGNEVGTYNVKLLVIDGSGNEIFSKSTTVTFNDPATAPAPYISQQSGGGQVTLTFATVPRNSGLVVYFFRKSGITGKVVPLGTGTVKSNGIATRTFDAKPGQILALYGKVMNATNIVTPYSNTIAFKVR